MFVAVSVVTVSVVTVSVVTVPINCLLFGIVSRKARGRGSLCLHCKQQMLQNELFSIVPSLPSMELSKDAVDAVLL